MLKYLILFQILLGSKATLVAQNCESVQYINKTQICMPYLKQKENVLNYSDFEGYIDDIKYSGQEFVAFYINKKSLELGNDNFTLYYLKGLKKDLSKEEFDLVIKNMTYYLNKEDFINSVFTEIELTKKLKFDTPVVIEKYSLNL